MKRFFILIFFMGILCFLSYQLGKSHSKIKIIEKQVEVIKYEKQIIQKVLMRPNPTRDTLLERMRQNKF